MPVSSHRFRLIAVEALEARTHFNVAVGVSLKHPALSSKPSKVTSGHLVVAAEPTTRPNATTTKKLSVAPALTSVGTAYSVPVDPETQISEDPSWQFALNPSGSPQSTSYNASSWTTLSLPYTWDGNSNAAGIGWYRKIISVPSNLLNGPELYLQFEGAYSVTSLYIDGTQIDYNPNASGTQAHGGGFAAFTFDVTAALNAAVPNGLSGHLIAVEVNANATAGVNGTNDSSVSPVGGGDYIHQGGLYRDVNLIATNKVHVPLMEQDPSTSVPVTGSGVYFTNLSNVVIGAASANIAVTTLLDNQTTSAQNVNVISYLVDESGIVQSAVSSSATIPASHTTDLSGTTAVDVVQDSTVLNPHLWDGRIDPYLYTLYVEVRNASTNALLDLSQQQVGIRSFTFNTAPSTGAPFLLDGQPYTLVGTDIHQDSGDLSTNGVAAGGVAIPVGWAQSTADIQADIDDAVDLGVTVFRTSHYQESQAFYDYCDQVGILVYTEDGTNGTLGTPGSAELANTEDQLSELVKQNYNHASVFAFGLANETDNSLTASFTTLNTLEHSLDKLTQYTSAIPQTHESAFAQYGDTSGGAVAITDIAGTHRYDYWYGTGGSVPGSVNVEQNTSNPTIDGTNQPLGITEMGGGGSAYQYTSNAITLPVANQSGGVTTNYHPANQQTLVEESQWADMVNPNMDLGFVWGKIVWQLFDTTDYKTEGDADGYNDKGLITRYGVKKDSYYFYQAQWNVPGRNYNSEKVIKISDQFWTARNSPTATVTVFSNMGAPTLFLNGQSLGTMSLLTVMSSGTLAGVSPQSETVPNTYVLTLSGAQALAVGKNSLKASVVYSGDGQTYSDNATWSYYTADGSYQHTASVNTTFNYDNIHQTTSNPYVVSGLADGVYDVQIICPSGGDNNVSLNGVTAGIDTNGLSTADTYNTRVLVTNGKLTLAAAPGAFSAAVTSMSYSLVNSTAAPTVNSVTVNNGLAQRSMINNLGIQFGEPVVLQSGAITLGLRNPSGGGYSTVYPLTASNPSGDETNYVLTLTSGANLDTLGDGIYDVNVSASLVADTVGDAMASNYTTTFHRLFGDALGDGYVGNTDAFLFREADLGGPSAYNQIFDYNLNGVIDSTDLQQFVDRLGTELGD